MRQEGTLNEVVLPMMLPGIGTRIHTLLTDLETVRDLQSQIDRPHALCANELMSAVRQVGHSRS